MQTINPKGLNILFAGFIFLIVDSCYLTYYSTMGSIEKQVDALSFPISVFDFWHCFLFDSLGGIILLLAATCFFLGFFRMYRYQRKLEKKSRKSIARFMEELKANK
jgi:formate hydrogenlyase subunit 3/multisubunit Na+/H+ antiporter MnhD subunit